MTAGRPTVPPAPHPDFDTLADLDAGALDPAAVEDVAAHIGGCARCTSDLAAFEAVRADLRALPPLAMPATVAARLDATIADLRRETAGPMPVAAAAPPQPPPPGAQQQRPRPVADLSTARERKSRRSLKISTGAVAAAFVLIAAGASVTALVTSAGKGSSDAGTAAAGNVPNEAAPDSSSGATSSSSVDGIPSYTKETLRGSLGSISRDSAVTDITRLGETGPAGVMADTARRQACERSIPPRPGPLIAVRRIEYDNKPAYVFVFTGPSGRPIAWVVDTSCGTSGALSAIVLDSVP